MSTANNFSTTSNPLPTSNSRTGPHTPSVSSISSSRIISRPPSISIPGRILNLSSHPRRQYSNPSITRSRNVTFPEDPVTMSQSPPKGTDFGPPSEDATPTRGRSESRSASLPPAIRSNDASPSLNPRSRSVKHLTCFWWKEKGSCKYTDEECLYAHHDTGRYTEAPRQLNPDEPAKAGRNLARALSNISIGGQAAAFTLNATPSSSRPSTPIGGFGARPTTPSLLSRALSPAPMHVPSEVVALQNELGFYKSLAVTNQQEKNLLINMIHGLQRQVIEVKDQVAEQIALLESEKATLALENEALKAASIYQPRSSPYGPIGSGVATAGPGNGISGNILSRIPTDGHGWRSMSSRGSAVAHGIRSPIRSVSPTNTNPSDDDDTENSTRGRSQGY